MVRCLKQALCRKIDRQQSGGRWNERIEFSREKIRPDGAWFEEAPDFRVPQEPAKFRIDRFGGGFEINRGHRIGEKICRSGKNAFEVSLPSRHAPHLRARISPEVLIGSA